MTKQNIYLSGEYLKYNPTWHSEDSPWKANLILKIIQRNNLHPTSVTEIGCGAGEILSQLHSKLPDNVTFTGYEISPQAFKLCQQKQNERLNFKLLDIFDEENAFYSLVLAIDVIEHIEDYIGFLKKLRLLGQFKIFHIPLDLYLLTILRPSPLQTSRRIQGHIHYFTRETALATLKDAGYEIIDYFYTPSYDLPTKSKVKLILKWPRKILYFLHQDFAVRTLGGFSLMVLTK